MLSALSDAIVGKKKEPSLWESAGVTALTGTGALLAIRAAFTDSSPIALCIGAALSIPTVYGSEEVLSIVYKKLGIDPHSIES